MTKNSMDVMLDLETGGTRAGCMILSLGATTFDLQHEFYARISTFDSEQCGFFSDPETKAWWNRQSSEARAEAFSGTRSVVEVLGSFSDWLKRLPAKEVFVWGNGADFDLPILGAYYAGMVMPIPWKPFNGRCYRTLKNLYPQIKAPAKNAQKHNAIEDAKYQALHAREILGQHFHKHATYQD